MDKKETLIAVYGTLRKGLWNHHIIQNTEYKGTFKSEPIYTLHDLGGFPGLKENGNTSVTFEVYSVNDMEAARVDRLEGYSQDKTPTFYDKKFINTPWGTAGVYIYVNDLSGVPIIESGDYVNKKSLIFQE